MDLNLIPSDIYSALVEGIASLSAVPIGLSLITMLIGGMGNNALTGPAQLSSDIFTPLMPFIDHYLQINGGQ
ncbi:hypothetical protein [Corynebacterium halotolerans]|uniref:hypothetical protein n=1 Tax=Corynebacterium halotolerans TaxID=225326 RepID=UPI003CF6FF54